MIQIKIKKKEKKKIQAQNKNKTGYVNITQTQWTQRDTNMCDWLKIIFLIAYRVIQGLSCYCCCFYKTVFELTGGTGRSECILLALY